MTYPSSWPRPVPYKPEIVASRITEQEKHDLYERRLTTRDLALRLGVSETYLSTLFPGKIAGPTRVDEESRKLLMETRKEYRNSFGQRVLSGELTIRKAGVLSRTPYKTMSRVVLALKKRLSDTGGLV